MTDADYYFRADMRSLDRILGHLPAAGLELCHCDACTQWVLAGLTAGGDLRRLLRIRPARDHKGDFGIERRRLDPAFEGIRFDEHRCDR